MKTVLRGITKVTECVLNASNIARLVPTVTSAHLALPTHFCSKAGVWSIVPSVTFQFQRSRISTSQFHTVKHASRDVQNVTSRLLDVLNVAKVSTCTLTSVWAFVHQAHTGTISYWSANLVYHLVKHVRMHTHVTLASTGTCFTEKVQEISVWRGLNVRTTIFWMRMSQFASLTVLRVILLSRKGRHAQSCVRVDLLLMRQTNLACRHVHRTCGWMKKDTVSLTSLKLTPIIYHI